MLRECVAGTSFQEALEAELKILETGGFADKIGLFRVLFEPGEPYPIGSSASMVLCCAFV